MSWKANNEQLHSKELIFQQEMFSAKRKKIEKNSRKKL
jgi:hypothetical protein